MKFKIVLSFLTIFFLVISCEGSSEEVFSVDQCVGEYVCGVDGFTMMVLPGGMKEVPTPPSSFFPVDAPTTIIVTKTGNNELTLKSDEWVLVAQVDPEGKLIIPETNIYMENEHFTMPLTATFNIAYITSKMLFIKQEAIGTATCNDKCNVFTLTVTNIQYFEGKKE